MRRAKSDYSIQTVTNALRTLQAIDGDIGVSELSRKLDLHKNNVFRLLATLEQKNFVEQIDNERYRLGPSCLPLARAYERSHCLTEEARHVVADLVELVGETVHLAVRKENAVHHLHGRQGPGHVVIGVRTGELPCHATALGKVLLACGRPTELARYDEKFLQGRSLSSRTERTITDRDKLIEHLRGVAGQGFALDLEECEPGMVCAAVPILQGGQMLAAALSVSAPALRVSQDDLESRIVPALQESARRVGRSVGAPH